MLCSCKVFPNDPSVIEYTVTDYNRTINNTIFTVYILEDARFYLYLYHSYNDKESDMRQYQHSIEEHVCLQVWNGTIPRFKLKYCEVLEKKLLDVLTIWYSYPSKIDIILNGILHWGWVALN